MRKHKLTLKTTINFRFYLLIVQVNEMIFMSSLCVCCNSKSWRTRQTLWGGSADANPKLLPNDT